MAYLMTDKHAAMRARSEAGRYQRFHCVSPVDLLRSSPVCLCRLLRHSDALVAARIVWRSKDDERRVIHAVPDAYLVRLSCDSSGRAGRWSGQRGLRTAHGYVVRAFLPSSSVPPGSSALFHREAPVRRKALNRAPHPDRRAAHLNHAAPQMRFATAAG